MKKTVLIVAVFACWAAGSGTAFSANAKLTLFASILPQRYFIERIAGDRAQVRIMVEPGASPATYEPKPRQMARLSEAAAYFAVGVPFERVWLSKIAVANPAMRVVHTDHGVEKIPMTPHHHDMDPERHPTEMQTGGIPDPHIWTSPALVMLQARNIFTALVEIDPAHRRHYVKNYGSFIRELVDLDTRLLQVFSRTGRLNRFMVFHPSWGYFADAYGLKQIPIEIEGKTPKPAQLAALVEHARQLNVRVIFVQPQFSTQSAQLIAREIGGRVVPADPLSPDWAENLKKQAEAFRAAMD
jgi:zinc transport system substrate-binding protein